MTCGTGLYFVTCGTGSNDFRQQHIRCTAASRCRAAATIVVSRPRREAMLRALLQPEDIQIGNGEGSAAGRCQRSNLCH